MVKAIILCGGQGTRIRDVAVDVPKPMIWIGDRPILWHIMKTFAAGGVTDFILCLGYRGWVIKEFFLNYHAFVADITTKLGRTTTVEYHATHPEEGWCVTLAETGEETQTGGRIARVRKYLQDEPLFCITYGDGVADIDIGELIAFHQSHGRVGTVTGVRPPGRFGVMRTTDEDPVIVREFLEKSQAAEGFINGGYFVFDHRLWDFLDDDPGLVFERSPLERLAAAGELMMFKHRGFWQPMDTYREWKLLNELWAGEEAPWKR